MTQELNSNSRHESKSAPHALEDPENNLLVATNMLLSQVGILAKKIKTIDELKRVASSMFVAIYETLVRNRLEGIQRIPKTPEDYILNCQIVIDSLAQQLQMDLSYITGESIYYGDLISLSHLVNLLQTVVLSRAKGSNLGNMPLRARNDSESLSSHESAFVFDEFHDGTASPATDDIKPPLRKLYDASQKKDGAPSTLTSQLDQLGTIDDVEIEPLKRMLDTIAQHKKLESARQRRESILRNKVNQASQRNQISLMKSLQALQTSWEQEGSREEVAYLKRRESGDFRMRRKIQQGIFKQIVRTKVASKNNEVTARVSKMREDMKQHMRGLHNILNERIKWLHEQENVIAVSNKLEIDECIKRTTDLRKTIKQKARNKLNCERQIVQQKREHMDYLRRQAQQQFLNILGNETWESELRTSSSFAVERHGQKKHKSKSR